MMRSTLSPRRWAFLLFALPVLLSAQPDRTHEKDFFQSEIKRYEAAMRRAPAGATATTALDVTYYRLAIAVTTSPQYLTGSVLIRALSKEDGLGTATLDLMNSMAIDSVKSGGAIVPFSQAAETFSVTLDRAYNAGEAVAIEVFYRGRPGSSGFGSFEFSAHSSTPWVWSLSEPYGAKDWWPCNDHPSDKADSADLYIACDSAYKAGSNGKLLSVTDNGNGTHTYHWHEGYPISTYLISVAITNYASFSNWFHYSPTDSMEILNYVLPENLSSALAQLPVVAEELQIYSDLFGLYPFINEKYGHSQFGWGGGMEHQTMTSLGGFNDGLTAHELAHQWFGDMITCRAWPDIWLNEGFATYCEHLYERAHYGEAWYWSGIAGNMADAKTATASTYVSDSGSVGSLFDWARVYAKGSVVLHMLRGVLGDSAFFASMYNYANHPGLRFATASTADFQAVCESTSGKPLSYFFDEWIYGQRYPRYTSSWTADSGAGGFTVTLGIRQTTLTATPAFFTMPVGVKLAAPGWDTTVTVANNLQLQSFVLPVSHRPTSVRLDPGNWIMCDKDTLAGFASAPAALNLGSAYVFSSRTDSVAVSNTGLVPLAVLSAATDDPAFSVSPSSAVIAPGASAAFVVTFTPSSQGARSAHLLFTHNAARSPKSINLSGSGAGYPVSARWNLLSLPVAAADTRVTAVFPWASSPAYAYAGTGGYTTPDSLRNGAGYWVKSDSARVIVIDGTPLAADTAAVADGWNLVGSISVPLPAAEIQSNPPGMVTSPFFRYANGYAHADTLFPGAGYWVKTAGGGELFLERTAPGAGASARIRPILAAELPPPPPGGAANAPPGELPRALALRQNYPNPFNGTTIIRYDLPESGPVKLALYNLLGEEVALLVDGPQDAGFRSVAFDAGRLPSGVYIYRLTAGAATAGKTMLLLK